MGGSEKATSQVAGLSELYRSRVMEHARAPKNFGALADPTHRAAGHNPLCGDQLTLALRCDEASVIEVAFEGAGCALSIASASMLTGAIEGREVADVQALRAEVLAVLANERPADAERLGEVAALSAVSAFPARVRCVTLAWETLGEALDKPIRPAS